MARIHFIRHAQSVANAGGVTMEHAVIPLSPHGHAQAEALAGVLLVQPSRVFVSQFARTQETARPFCARTGGTAHVHPLLNEFSTLDPAMLVGMTAEQRRPLTDAYWQAADPTARMGDAADTFEEFDTRVRDFVRELPALPDGSVLFGHGIWFGLLAWQLLGFDTWGSQGMRDFRRFQVGLPMPNCAAYVLEGEPGRRWTWFANEPVMRAMAAALG